MSRKADCLLFLSWQSDRRDCRKFVDSMVDKLSGEVSEFATVSIDRDTVNVPGAPDIGDTIFEKIDQCDIFIADLTLINDKDSGYRRTPNPNVLIELGYAIKALGWERIILLQCLDYGDIEELPFDINHRRIANFSIGKNIENEKEAAKKKMESKNQVVGKISKSIKLLLEKNMLFGGKKKRIPKFEITLSGSGGNMMNLSFILQNVSSIIISSLRSHGLWAVFDDDRVKELEHRALFGRTALNAGEQTILHLNNQELGAGRGYNNSSWSNIDLKWQFSCEDEDGNEYWYEMKRHIDIPDTSRHQVPWEVKCIG